jgi:uncharacterized protein (TIGR00369 family)
MKEASHLETIRSLLAEPAAGQLTARMGIVITEIAHGRVAGTMPVAGNLQPYGLMHGGASCVLAETLGSIAGALHAGPGRAGVGIELNVSHHRALREGVVTGVCTPLSEGHTLATYEIVITDEQGWRVSTARLTCSLRGRVPGEPGGAGE